MQSHPAMSELLEAVRDLIERRVLPAATEPDLRYRARIAAHLLEVVERELIGRTERLMAELGRLDELLGRSPRAALENPARLHAMVEEGNRALCERIRAGDADGGPWRSRVFAHVRATVRDQVAIDNPAELEATS
jgi:hypothetical protein